MDADFLIVGGGAAGLSLAVHLIERGPRRARVLIVEPRAHYGRDRTFCFWKVMRHPFERCVSHTWPRWRVATRDGEVVRGSAEHPYQHVPAVAFYEEAARRIEHSTHVERLLDTSALALHDRGDRVIAETSAGTLSARLAFDSRPAPRESDAQSAEVTLLQHFVGWFVEADRPAFDADTATLMDFVERTDEGIHFVYVLPFSRTHALVEDTWFSPAVLPAERYEASLAAFMERRHPGVIFRVTDRERGVIPMTTAPPPAQAAPRIYRIGLAGGLGKPSTGYAFLANPAPLGRPRPRPFP